MSSSSSTIRTTAGELLDSLIRSSICTGAGPSKPTMRARSPAAGSTVSAAAPSVEVDCGSRAGISFCSTIGRKTEIMSAVSVTGVAPCLMRSFVPSARGSSGEPGTAKTSRPCSSANRALLVSQLHALVAFVHAVPLSPAFFVRSAQAYACPGRARTARFAVFVTLVVRLANRFFLQCLPISARYWRDA